MSTFCFGSVCFKVFDADRDGVLCREEIHEMVVALLEVWRDNRTDSIPVSHLTWYSIEILKSDESRFTF